MTRLIARIVALVPALLLALSANAQFGFGDDDPAVEVSASPSRAQVLPGGNLAIAVVLDHAETYHSWPSADQDVLPPEIAEFAIRTAINPGSVEGLTFGPIQWPETHAATVPDVTGASESTTAQTYSDRAIAYLPILIDAEASPGARTIALTIEYQACDDKSCLMPETVELEVPIEIVADLAGETAVSGADFQNFDASVFADPGQWDDRPAPAEQSQTGAASRTFFGVAVPTADTPAGLAIVALLAAVGGFILNLTPCVLPVIPIKVMTISQHAGTPGKSVYLGLWMAAGVTAFWVAVGLPVALISGFTDPSRLFGIWYVTLGIGLVIALMGVGIMGLFAINLPQSVYAVNPKADTAWGSFVFGIMTGVLGLPCFGFVAGALLAGAATLPVATILAIFGFLGVGMALPYLILAIKPGWVEKIPRTGPASELVKQVMGLLLLAAAAFFIGAGVQAYIGARPELAASMPWWGKVVHWWAIALLVGAACVWLVLRTFQISTRLTPRLVFTLTGLALLFGGSAAAYGMTSKALDDFWVPYTEAAYRAQLDDDKVVVIKFTADWCITCKGVEVVLSRGAVKDALLGDKVVPMVADNTADSAPGWKMMSELGQAGIPLLLIDGPGVDEPILFNAYTSDMVADAIERARGE